MSWSNSFTLGRSDQQQSPDSEFLNPGFFLCGGSECRNVSDASKDTEGKNMGPKRQKVYSSFYDRGIKLQFDAAVDRSDVDTIYEFGRRLGYSEYRIWVEWEIRERKTAQRNWEAAQLLTPERRRADIAKRFGVPVQWVMLPEELEARRALRNKPISFFLFNLKFSIKAKLGTYLQIAGGSFLSS
jgi:hypothetical protein